MGRNPNHGRSALHELKKLNAGSTATGCPSLSPDFGDQEDIAPSATAGAQTASPASLHESKRNGLNPLLIADR
jgi:hypothetical protein